MDRALNSPTATDPSTTLIRTVLADADCLFRASLRQLLAVPPAVIHDVYGVELGAGFEVVGEAGTGDEMVRVVESVQPDLLLLDVNLPRMSGLDAIQEMTKRPSMTILLARVISRPQMLTAIQLGIRGLILKHASTELLFEAITGVLAGRCWLDQTLVTDLLESARPLIQSSRAVGGASAYGLTPREREVLSRVAAGCANKEIARDLSVSEETIKHHLTRMFTKVGASNRVELAMIAAERGLIDPPSTSPVSTASASSASPDACHTV
jgi:DNA-binding NarL/FixJ family response regulator